MPRGTKVSKERKRVAIAKGLVAGKGPIQIAREIGTVNSHVQRIMNEPETQQLILQAMAPQRVKLLEMAERAVEAVDQALEAERSDEADHRTRMTAVERYGDLLELAEGGKRYNAAVDTGGVHFTLQQIFKTLQLGGTDGDEQP